MSSAVRRKTMMTNHLTRTPRKRPEFRLYPERLTTSSMPADLSKESILRALITLSTRRSKRTAKTQPMAKTMMAKINPGMELATPYHTPWRESVKTDPQFCTKMLLYIIIIINDYLDNSFIISLQRGIVFPFLWTRVHLCTAIKPF